MRSAYPLLTVLLLPLLITPASGAPVVLPDGEVTFAEDGYWQTGARFEGGVHVPTPHAAADLYAAYERRVDGYPTSRQPSSWFEIGFRLGTPSRILVGLPAAHRGRRRREGGVQYFISCQPVAISLL